MVWEKSRKLRRQIKNLVIQTFRLCDNCLAMRPKLSKCSFESPKYRLSKLVMDVALKIAEVTKRARFFKQPRLCYGGGVYF